MNARPAVVGFGLAALLLLVAATRRPPAYASQAPEDAPDLLDQLQASAAEAVNLVRPTPASGMDPSPQLLGMLKAGEGLRLARYRLGDGGWTLGYGRYFPDSGAPPPERIDAATAEAWFAEDVQARGARWVRAYVNADLTQQQFDALVSMAYNLSPKSFRTIADAVNEGQDPEAASLQFVRAGTHLENGLRKRRGREIALYREGVYA